MTFRVITRRPNTTKVNYFCSKGVALNFLHSLAKTAAENNPDRYETGEKGYEPKAWQDGDFVPFEPTDQEYYRVGEVYYELEEEVLEEWEEEYDHEDQGEIDESGCIWNQNEEEA